mmetsp:Transcript_15387/g.11192  ORF Transcript_15387/g.11192 Transcript_15387/m.11192 type:complete len:83 (+) Transcript_15387:165-413(+)
MIPKFHIKNSGYLTNEHAPLVNHMKMKSSDLLNQWHPNREHYFAFHKPFFTTVNHLHLHLMVPPFTLIGKLEFNFLFANPLP